MYITSKEEFFSANEILSKMERINNIEISFIRGNFYKGDPSRDDFTFLLLERKYTHQDTNLMKKYF